jgi:hypothetical protein
MLADAMEAATPQCGLRLHLLDEAAMKNGKYLLR